MRLLRAAVVGCCLVGLAACGGGGGGGGGGGDGDGDAAADPLTKADYIKQGDEICLRLSNEVKGLPAPTSQAEVGDLLDRTIALNDVASNDLVALSPPLDGRELHAALLRAVRDRTARDRQAREAVRRGDFPAMQSAIQDGLRIGEGALDAARAYGFTVCGANPG